MEQTCRRVLWRVEPRRALLRISDWYLRAFRHLGRSRRFLWHVTANSAYRRTAYFFIVLAFARWQMALRCRHAIPIRNDSARSFIWPDHNAYFHAVPRISRLLQ